MTRKKENNAKQKTIAEEPQQKKAFMITREINIKK